jgi:hypothetical protein
MAKEKLKPLLWRDPISGEDLTITELHGEDSGITIRGHFEIPKYAKLEGEQAKFLETFLRCRGMMNAVERELGISYPTVRARLDHLLDALGLTPIKEDHRKDKNDEKARKILDQLESGEITAQEAKQKLNAGGKK